MNSERAADTSPWTPNLDSEAGTGPQGNGEGDTARLSLQRRGRRPPPVGPRTCEVTHTPPGTAISSVSALWDPVGVLTRFFLEGDSGDTGGWCVFSTSQVAPEF